MICHVNKNYAVNDITGTTYSDPIDLDACLTYSVQAVYDVNTPAAKTFLSGVSEVTTVTFQSKAASTAGDYIVIPDTAGLSWGISINKAGTDPQPTGAVWAAIPAARKTHVNISSVTTAIQVAALVELAFDALTAVSIATDDTAANGTMLFTQNVRGVIAAVARHNADDSGNGGLSFVQTTVGVASTVDITANTLTKVAHGLSTGLKVQATKTGTHIGGLADTTDYFVIKVDADTIKLATSLANAIADPAVAIDLTTQGSEGNTTTLTSTAIAGASLTLQKSNDYAKADANWTDVAAATSITADGTTWFEDDAVGSRFLRLKYTLTAGRINSDNFVVAKG